MEKYCNCENIGAVARDMKSTCMQCGGIDAYKKSKLRIKEYKLDEKRECMDCGKQFLPPPYESQKNSRCCELCAQYA